jgi:anti-sigma factor RsiW
MDESDIMLKVQAFVDGELPEAEQAEIAALIARDADVHALVKELKQTRQALAGFEDEVSLPEDPEFHWSRIRRGIEALPPREPEPEQASPAGLLMRWLLPAGAVAAVAVALLLTRGPGKVSGEVAWTAYTDDVSAFTYRDYEQGMTLMWLSYGGDNAVADSGEPATIN